MALGRRPPSRPSDNGLDFWYRSPRIMEPSTLDMP